MEKGKEKCRRLREIRQKMAYISRIEYEPHECEHEGDCPGTWAESTTAPLISSRS